LTPDRSANSRRVNPSFAIKDAYSRFSMS
jgi:hypothetical protein